MLNKLKYLLALSIILLMTSCSSDEDLLIEDTDNFTESSLRALGMGEKGEKGNQSCFELVFPIEILFEDGSSLSAEDNTELREGVKAWKEANPDSESRPLFVFPIQIEIEDELVELADMEALKEIKGECKGEREGRGHKGNKEKCFELVFPLELVFEDGSVLEVADRKALRTASKEWKEANPDSESRPSFSYPIEVVIDDEVLGLDNEEAFFEIKEACKGERGGKGDGERGDRERCFELVFPISVSFPNVEVTSFENHKDLRSATHEWNKANRDAETRPEFVFPINIEQEGEEIEVGSKDDLDALKEACKEG